MSLKKLGTLVKTARSEAELTQEQLARKVKGVSASDISKVERGQCDLTKEQIKLIAKALGITQKSLLDELPASYSGGSCRSTGTTKKSTSTTKKTSTTTKKTTGTSVKLTGPEKKLVELYREADTDTKKQVVALLKGDMGEFFVALVADKLKG